MAVLSKEDYTVGWICALPNPEWKVSRLLLDEVHDHVPLGLATKHQYVYGSMNGHNIVMGCLPATQIGTATAAAVASEMGLVFPCLRFGLMVGTGGGVPSESKDIRLGDVVVSQPNTTAQTGGVIQYDFGKTTQGGKFQQTGMLNQPPEILLSALGKVQSTPRRDSRFDAYLKSSSFEDEPEFTERPRDDRLFKASYPHKEGEATCRKCKTTREIQRSQRNKEGPVIHYGTIASGNQVMKDASTRDRISRENHGVLCFEMEAAGLMNRFPCLVIRGICDYCDSHKNKEWQPLAAAAAAAWAKELLRNVAPAEVSRGATMREEMEKIAATSQLSTWPLHREEHDSTRRIIQEKLELSQANQTQSIFAAQDRMKQSLTNDIIDNLSLQASAITSSQANHSRTLTVEIHQVTAKLPLLVGNAVRHAMLEAAQNHAGRASSVPSQEDSPHNISKKRSADTAFSGDGGIVVSRSWIQYRKTNHTHSQMSSRFGVVQVNSCELIDHGYGPTFRHKRPRKDRTRLTSINFTPARWLSPLLSGSFMGLVPRKVSWQGWKLNLVFSRLVPDDSPIFQFCESGNIEGVQALLASGQASVVDVNSWGETPLHYAAGACQPELCEMLLLEGADVQMRGHDTSCSTPFTFAIEGLYHRPFRKDDPRPPDILARQIQVFRILMATGQDLHEADYETDILATALRVDGPPSYSEAEGCFSQRLLSPALWLYSQYCALVQEYSFLAKDRKWHWDFGLALTEAPGTGLVEQMTKLCSREDLEIVLTLLLTGYGIGFHRDTDLMDLKAILEAIGTLHCEPTFSRDWSRTETTPKTLLELAMKRSSSFNHFKGWLKALELDLEIFANEDVRIMGSNWSADTINILLDNSYHNRLVRNFFCKICGMHECTTIYSEPHWKFFVEHVRRGEDPETLDEVLTEEERMEIEKWERDAKRKIKSQMCMGCVAIENIEDSEDSDESDDNDRSQNSEEAENSENAEESDEGEYIDAPEGCEKPEMPSSYEPWLDNTVN